MLRLRIHEIFGLPSPEADLVAPVYQVHIDSTELLDRLIGSFEGGCGCPETPPVIVAFILYRIIWSQFEVVDHNAYFVLFLARQTNATAKLSDDLILLLIESTIFNAFVLKLLI